jgi:hypothetical protein
MTNGQPAEKQPLSPVSCNDARRTTALNNILSGEMGFVKFFHWQLKFVLAGSHLRRGLRRPSRARKQDRGLLPPVGLLRKPLFTLPTARKTSRCPPRAPRPSAPPVSRRSGGLSVQKGADKHGRPMCNRNLKSGALYHGRWTRNGAGTPLPIFEKRAGQGQSAAEPFGGMVAGHRKKGLTSICLCEIIRAGVNSDLAGAVRSAEGRRRNAECGQARMRAGQRYKKSGPDRLLLYRITPVIYR